MHKHVGTVSRIASISMLRLVCILSLFALAACVKEPVDWGNVSYRSSQLGDPAAISSVRDANLPAVAGTVGACRRSVAAAVNGSEVFRAWWAVRGDSNAVLSMQRSLDGGATWQPPVPV